MTLPERLHPAHPRVRLRGRDLSDPSDRDARSTACRPIKQPRRDAGAGRLRVHRDRRRADSADARGGQRAAALRAGDLERLRRGRGRTRAPGRSSLRAARAGGARLIGPNCLGLYTPRGKVTFAEIGPNEVGHASASISQSGGLGTDIIRRGLRARAQVLGPRHGRQLRRRRRRAICSSSISPTTKTRVIGMYIETAQGRPPPLRDPARRAGSEARRDPERRPHAAGRRRRRPRTRARSRATTACGSRSRARPAACSSTRSISSSTRCSLFQALDAAARSIRRSASCCSATAAARACSRPTISRASAST